MTWSELRTGLVALAAMIPLVGVVAVVASFLGGFTPWLAWPVGVAGVIGVVPVALRTAGIVITGHATNQWTLGRGAMAPVEGYGEERRPLPESPPRRRPEPSALDVEETGPVVPPRTPERRRELGLEPELEPEADLLPEPPRESRRERPTEPLLPELAIFHLALDDGGVCVVVGEDPEEARMLAGEAHRDPEWRYSRATVLGDATTPNRGVVVTNCAPVPETEPAPPEEVPI